MSNDYYKILGVEKSSSDEDIKKAYRKLAHQYHPDKTGGDEKKFKEINEAYQTLSNKEKRAQYDRFGNTTQGAGGPGGFGGFSQGGFDFQGGDFGDLGDIFETFFNGMGGQQKRRTYAHGSDMEMVQEITLEDAYRGIEKNVTYKTNIHCAQCKGLGHDAKATFSQCKKCDGRGEVRETRSTFFGNFAQVRTCTECHGVGQIPDKRCSSCSGSGVVRGEKKIAVKILPGIADGQIIKMVGAGEAGERGSQEGDLFLHVRVKPHAIFSRQDDHLIIEKEIQLINLLAYFSDSEAHPIYVTTISGGKLALDIPRDFTFNKPFKVTSEGMPHFNRSGKGDLFVHFKIVPPHKMSKDAKRLLEELRNEMR
ncbi:MAG: Chaperone protein DnaJ [Candidatus Wolfebacteria bacterium GW2011_GWC2_39_22]|uniref:Chaperone protein DnaJ n=1 Tax=Candidatus Wolfebacteria bacterium GW2011_GWC2_39_22 TaxID=1619013 RepID=A0A0G0QR54_9BACT|nr:MAG: Chaperone protein DnaJ [Candidatus Wolfebacteria bacterium GW2011_GWC2_39_22]HBI25469.1 molecular chaperone DnaJ [Candidatus Wolfebacteria bacterium]